MLRLLVLSALLGSPSAEPRPDWVGTLPQVPGRLYALGTADLGGGDSQGIARASDRARLEVVARLRSSVKGRTSVVTRTSESRQEGAAVVASGDRQTLDEVQVGAQAQDLPGLVVERTFVDREGGAAFALAYLDIAQAQGDLSARLALLKDCRLQSGDDMSRKARWRLRKVKGDLAGLEALAGILAGTGMGLQPALRAEQKLLDARLAKLEAATLPPLDLGTCTLSLRTNVDLPPGIRDYLEAQLSTTGLRHRDSGADFILDLAFKGGEKGPQFIFASVELYQGVEYRLDALMRILDGSGGELTRPTPIQFAQDRPEGMVEKFRSQFGRRLTRLLVDLQAELQ